MDKLDGKTLFLYGGLCAITLIIALSIYVCWNTQTQVQTISKDINTILIRMDAQDNYIQQNSNTLTYINQNCKVTNDTNELTVLTCLKVKA
jgi:hypothetical protein